MCVNYQPLICVTKFDCFTLPRIDKAFDTFACATSGGP